jgi:transposase-like protein
MITGTARSGGPPGALRANRRPPSQRAGSEPAAPGCPAATIGALAGGGDTVLDLDAWRIHRSGAPLQCPRCGSPTVQRWGWFVTRCGERRRRYRCTACRRTHSDFTGTPLAYLKRLDQWPSFCSTTVSTWPIRRAARRLGLAASTVFRWRHRLLDGVRSRETVLLAGDVVVSETCFPYSEKGRRPLQRPPRRRPDPLWVCGARAWVVLARDEGGRPLAALTGPHRPRVADLGRTLLPRLARHVTLTDSVGPLGATASLARAAALGYRRRAGAERAGNPALGYGVELRRWLGRFRGVATRYLDNYLAWHRIVAPAHSAPTDR